MEMNKAFLLKNGNEIQQMEKAYCQNEGKELQDVLEANHDILVGEQINPAIPRRWLLVRREMPVPDPGSGLNKWSIDFFFVDQDAIPTFVECKRYNDTRSRREVIGQMLDYAANGHYYWSADILKSFAEKTAARRGEALDDILSALQQENQYSADEYFEKVENNLREAQLRLVFFLEEAPFELRSIVEFLNKQMERTEVLIIEARQFCHGDLKVLVPTLFGYTEQARRIKRTVAVDPPGASRRKWDRLSILQSLEQQNNPRRLANVKELLTLADGNHDLFNVSYGMGQTGSIVFKNNMGKSLFYIFTSGTTQFSAAGYLRQKIDFFRTLEEKYHLFLQWKAKFEEGKFPGLTKLLEDLSEEEMEKLKDFLLETAQGVKDQVS
jgi:hypothetical protein